MIFPHSLFHLMKYVIAIDNVNKHKSFSIYKGSADKFHIHFTYIMAGFLFIIDSHVLQYSNVYFRLHIHSALWMIGQSGCNRDIHDTRNVILVESAHKPAPICSQKTPICNLPRLTFFSIIEA